MRDETVKRPFASGGDDDDDDKGINDIIQNRSSSQGTKYFVYHQIKSPIFSYFCFLFDMQLFHPRAHFPRKKNICVERKIKIEKGGFVSNLINSGK